MKGKSILGKKFDMEEIAEKYDMNNDGVLSIEEFSYFLDDLSLQVKLNEKEKVMLLKLADKDGDGNVALDEMFSFLKADLKLDVMKKKAQPSYVQGGDDDDWYPGGEEEDEDDYDDGFDEFDNGGENPFGAGGNELAYDDKPEKPKNVPKKPKANKPKPKPKKPKKKPKPFSHIQNQPEEMAHDDPNKLSPKEKKRVLENLPNYIDSMKLMCLSYGQTLQQCIGDAPNKQNFNEFTRIMFNTFVSSISKLDRRHQRYRLFEPFPLHGLGR